jgi:hypothetical protein
MSKEKLDSFTSDKIHFISEQIGVPENEFKESIVALFQSLNKHLRAYLAQVENSEEKDFSVSLCIASEDGEDENLAKAIALIFRRMFGPHEHLDILFLTESQEKQLRKVCCPFFSSKRFDQPDFYLISSEGYGFDKVRACYKERRLMNGHPDGYMLCEIDLPIVGQAYGLGHQDIQKVIVASRYIGYTLFPIKEWPAYVHVARLIYEIPDNKFVITENDIESIGWAELYESSMSIRKS